MNFKEFYQKFGRDYPLTVVKTAFCYFEQGHDVKPALCTAWTIYIANQKNRPLRYKGYMAINQRKGVTVYSLETETVSGMNRVSVIDTDKRTGLTFAPLGENFCYTSLAVFEAQNNKIFGAYTHRNRYVAIVELSYEGRNLPDETCKQLQMVADTLAKNALAYYPQYSDDMEKIKFHIKKDGKKPKNAPEEMWPKYFEQQILRFEPKINDGYECGWSFFNSAYMDVAGFLEKMQSELKTEIKIADIKLFGL